MDTRRTAFDSADVEATGDQLHLVPHQVAQLRGPQANPRPGPTLHAQEIKTTPQKKFQHHRIDLAMVQAEKLGAAFRQADHQIC